MKTGSRRIWENVMGSAINCRDGGGDPFGLQMLEICWIMRYDLTCGQPRQTLKQREHRWQRDVLSINPNPKPTTNHPPFPNILSAAVIMAYWARSDPLRSPPRLNVLTRKHEPRCSKTTPTRLYRSLVRHQPQLTRKRVGLGRPATMLSRNTNHIIKGRHSWLLIEEHVHILFL